MKTVRIESVEVVNELCCDRCGQRAIRSDPAFQE